MLSFNTVYVSTESTDSISTVLFTVMVWAFAKARDTNRMRWFAVSGVLAGVAAQFRPNLILIPCALLALNWLLGPRETRRLRQGLVVIAAAVMVLTPWTWRNYVLTREFLLPTSTHGGVQLWADNGTLQSGRYIESRAHNPRAVFATAPFDYTSLAEAPISFAARSSCAPAPPEAVELVYRIDADARRFGCLSP